MLDGRSIEFQATDRHCMTKLKVHSASKVNKGHLGNYISNPRPHTFTHFQLTFTLSHPNLISLAGGTTANMLSSRPILDLPQELVIRIATHLTTVELGYFRRSCKHIERYLFRSFAREFFTKRQFLIEHESLEALLGIANHPGLSPNLEEVILDVRTFGLSRGSKYTRFVENRLRNGHFSRDMLLYTGSALTMLTESFSKLKCLRSVGIRDFNGHGRDRDSKGGKWRPWGWSCVDNYHGQRDESINIDFILPLIISALARAHVQPTKLEVLLRGRFLGRDAFTAKDTIEFDSVLDNLKTVMLKIGRSLSLHDMDHEGHASLSYHLPIIGFLHSLKAVEQLRLNFCSCGRQESTETILLDWMAHGGLGRYLVWSKDSIVPVADFKSLTMLEIGFAMIRPAILLRVLLAYNLKSFALWRVNLYPKASTKKDENPWMQFLIDLSRQLPKSSTICKILIGNCGQDYLEGMYSRVRRVSWKTRMNKKVYGDTIKYDSLHSTDNVRAWLLKTSNHAFVESTDGEYSETPSEVESDDDDYSMFSEAYDDEDGEDEDEEDEE